MNKKNKWLYVLLGINLISIIYYVLYFIKFNHTPAPFIYDKSDTFMDFFNTLHWSYDATRYETWQSIYPPINFLFLKFVNFIISDGIYTEPFDIRHNNPGLIWFIIISFFLMPIFALKSYDWLNLKGKICVFLIFITSAPFLFTLERGNLIMYTLPFLYLFFYNINIYRAVSFSLLINIKPYFGVFLIPTFMRKKYRDFFLFILFSATVYIFSSVIIGPEFLFFLKNLFTFNENIFSLREVMSLPLTITSHIIFFSNADLSILTSSLLGKFLIVNLLYIGYISLIILFLYVIFRFKNILNHKDYICLFVFGLTNFFYQVGGYSIISYFILVPHIYKNYRFLIYFLIPLFMPLDIVPVFNDLLPYSYSFLYGGFTEVNYTLGLGSLLRPILNYLLLFFMCIMIIKRFGNINLPFTKGKKNEKL